MTGSVAARGPGAGAKFAGQTVNTLAEHHTTLAGFINRMGNVGLMSALGFGTIDPEHWQRDLMVELGTLGVARGGRAIANKLPGTPPAQPRGAGGRFAPWSQQYRQQRSNYINWSDFKRAAAPVVDTASSAVGSLLWRMPMNRGLLGARNGVASHALASGLQRRSCRCCRWSPSTICWGLDVGGG
jgi:hypothetical protein